MFTWSETYFRQDLFPSYVFSVRQFPEFVNFRLKSSSDLDSGFLPRFYGEFMYANLKNRAVVTTTESKMAKTAHTNG